jgi:hypothetical protein
VLRRWVVDDAAALLTALQDPLVRHYSGYLLEDRAQALETVQRLGGAVAAGGRRRVG